MANSRTPCMSSTGCPNGWTAGQDADRSSRRNALRRALRWEAGTKLVVESTPEGVLLKPAPVFGATRPEDVFGRLRFDGTPKSLDEMEAGVLTEAKRRHEGG